MNTPAERWAAMSPEQLEIWAQEFGCAVDRIIEHECLQVVSDVVGRPTNAQMRLASRVLSACQERACYEDFRTPLRCQARRLREEREAGEDA